MAAEQKAEQPGAGHAAHADPENAALEPMDGCGIGLRLEQISKGVCHVNAGSLFPALRRPRRSRRDGRP